MNAVDQQSNTRKHCTVAELLAREAGGGRTPYHRERPQVPTRAPVSVTALLRREGVDFAGSDQPTVQLPTSAPVHVTELLQREAEQSEPTTKRRGGSRIAAAGSAAALCGLTIAGLIALKPTIASSPGGLADDSSHPAGTAPTQQDQIKPTTTVLKRANVEQATAGQTGSTASAQGSSQGAASHPAAAQRQAESSAAPAPQPTTQQPAPKPAQPAEPKPQPENPPAEQPPAGGGGSEGGLLDPITDPVGEILDPVVGTVTGTLGGLLG